jgi:hypothetical protein
LVSRSDGASGADLAASATELLARNALEALRGPMSRGAVPTAALAEHLHRPRTTVSREISRETGRTGSTAFDLVVTHAFDADANGQRPRWEAVLSSYIASQGPPGLSPDATFSAHAVKKMLGDAFISTASGKSRTHVLVGYLLHSAALLTGARHDSPGSLPNAKAILDLRSDSYTRSTALYASALQFMLSATRRRPKGDRTVEDIAVMLHSLYDGYYLRHALDAERYPLAPVVETLWDLTVVMTEPGFLASGEGSSPLRDDLIRVTLDFVSCEKKMPELSDVAIAAGHDMAVVTDEFAGEAELAEACLESLCSQAMKLRALADQTKGMACWTLRGFLGWLESLVAGYGPLVQAASDAKIWTELSSLIDMLILSVADSLNPIARQEIAKRLVDAVRSGSDWQPALSVLLDVLDPAPGLQALASDADAQAPDADAHAPDADADADARDPGAPDVPDAPGDQRPFISPGRRTPTGAAVRTR